MDDFSDDRPDGLPVRSWSVRIKRAARTQEARAVALLVKSAAPLAAIAGRLDLITSWLGHLPDDTIQRDPHLLYWSGLSLTLTRPADAYPRLRLAFQILGDGADGTWSLMAWAGLVDVIFILYRDLRELDPLIAWLTTEREVAVDSMPRPLRGFIVGSALFALPFRTPLHPRLHAWRERAERLIEHNPTSNLGARMTAGLILDYTWRGDMAAAELVWKRFDARASRTEMSPLGTVLRPLNEATLRLHQGRLDECVEAVARGLAAASTHGVRVWDGVMHCLAATAHVSRGSISEARLHLAAIEQLFAQGIPVDEAFYRAILFWCDFVSGDRLGVVQRCLNVLQNTDTKGVPYFMAVCRIMNGLSLFESGHLDDGRALIAEGKARGRDLNNPLLMWVAELFEAHVQYAMGDIASGDAALQTALQLGSDHYLSHFFCWPRQIIAGLIDRALERNWSADYLKHLIGVHALAPAEVPTRSDAWAFPVRIYLFGNPRVVHLDGRTEPLSMQFQRQVELLVTLVARPLNAIALQVIGAEMYAGEDVEPISSLKGVLHSLRTRMGKVVLQSNAQLALDFASVWIDAASFQWLQHQATDSVAIEAWLDRYYQDHLLAPFGASKIIEKLRQRLARQAERVIRECHARCIQCGDEVTARRLERRWFELFPSVFADGH